jgi:PAS domain S-box-containing protein
MIQGQSTREQIQIVQIETFLKDFGFNNREIAIYLALCKTKKATPSDISKLADVERSDVYRILDSLVTKGFAVKILEKPIQYALAPPGKAFKRDLEEKHHSLSTLETQIEETNKLILDYTGKSASGTDASRFEVIKSRQFVFDRLAEMFAADRCQKEVLFYGTEKSVIRLLYYLRDLIIQVPKRHIDFKMLLPVTESNIVEVLALSKFADIKHLQQVRSRVVIVDRKESILIYNASDDESYSDDLGLWLNNAQFSEMQAEMFDAQWELAVDLHTRVKELESEKNIKNISSEPEIAKENTPILFTIDPKGKITYLSQNVDSYLTNAIQVYTNGLLKERITEFSYPEDQNKISKIWETGKQGLAGKEEFRTIQENGDIRWWSISWLPLADKKGETETIRVALKDITANKRIELLENELVKNETLLVRSQEIAHIGSWELDLLTNEITLSDEVYRILGLPPECRLNSYQAFLNALPSENFSFFARASKSITCPENKNFDIEEKILRADGLKRVFNIKGEVIYDEKGKAIRAIGMVHDITELKTAQEALVESESRFRLQFEEANDAIILADIETGLIVDANRAALQLTGYPREELIGRNQKSIHPESNLNFKYHTLNPAEPAHRKLLSKTGEIRDVVIKANIIEIKGKRLMQGIFRDVTDQKKIEEAVWQTKHNYETFFDSIDDLLYVLDIQGNMLQVNHTVLNRLGYTLDELIGKSVLMVHPPDLRDEALRIVLEMIAGKKTFCPIPVITKDGHLIPVETRVTKGEWDGKLVLFGVSKDLSQLKLSEARFSQAFHSNAVLMALSQEESGEFIDVNQAFLDTLGYKREEIIGKTAKDLNIFANLQERIRALAILRETGRVRNFDVLIRTKSGANLNGLFSVDYIAIGEAASTCILTTMVDITERLKTNNKKENCYSQAL